jgi:hypothetical protein
MFEDSGFLHWARQHSYVLYARIILDLKPLIFADLRYSYLKEQLLIEKVKLIEKGAIITGRLGAIKSKIKPWEENDGFFYILNVIIEFLFKLGLSTIPIISITLIFSSETKNLVNLFATLNPPVLLAILCGIGLVQFFSNGIYKWLLSHPEGKTSYWQKSNTYNKQSLRKDKPVDTNFVKRSLAVKDSRKHTEQIWFIKIKIKDILFLASIIFIIGMEGMIGYSIIKYYEESKVYSSSYTKIADQVQEAKNNKAKSENKEEIDSLSNLINKLELDASQNKKPVFPDWSLGISSSVFVFANIFYAVCKAFRERKIDGIRSAISRCKSELKSINNERSLYDKMYKEIDNIQNKSSYKGNISDEKIMFDRYHSFLYGKLSVSQFAEESQAIIDRIADINGEPINHNNSNHGPAN